MAKSKKWLDITIMGISLLVITASMWWLFGSGLFAFSLDEDEQLIWHLIRSSGLVAYMLLLASTVWGLFISSQFVKDWSPGVVSLTLHSTISWLALLLTMVHAGLLLFDDYFTYTLGDILIPFTGPYRPLAVGLGTLGFWIMIVVSLSFSVKKHIGHTLWKRIHYASYAVFAMVSVHGIMAGTDGDLIGFRILVGIGVVLVVLLLGVRTGRDQMKQAQKVQRRSPQRAK